MKLCAMSRSVLSLTVLSLAAVLSGCSTLDAELDEDQPGSVTEVPHRAILPSYTGREVIRGRVEGIAFSDAAWELPSAEREKIRAVATYLRVGAERVIVAGGAEVSSPEYARQLGQQRALAVKDALVLEGIPASQIVTVSYGLNLPGKGGDRVEFGFVPNGETAL